MIGKKEQAFLIFCGVGLLVLLTSKGYAPKIAVAVFLWILWDRFKNRRK